MRRRREALAVALGGVLQPLEHRVEPFDVGLHERRHQPAPRVEAGAGHHPEVDVAVGGDALLEHEAGLDEASSATSSSTSSSTSGSASPAMFGSPCGS